jgi:hypothetical protein
MTGIFTDNVLARIAPPLLRLSNQTFKKADRAAPLLYTPKSNTSFLYREYLNKE